MQLLLEHAVELAHVAQPTAQATKLIVKLVTLNLAEYLSQRL